MTLLYIEDDEDDVDIFTEAVEAVAPHTTLHVATDGQEALELLGDLTTAPDYIFLDINLPMISGKEFLKQLKAKKKFRNIPVVMCSTSNDGKDKEDCQKLGAIDFIVTPPEFRMFCEVLKRFI